MAFQSQLSLFSKKGERKYLNRRERCAFYACAKNLPQERQIFCLLLYFTGARIGEIYELTSRQIDDADNTVIIRCLKRRRNDLYRQIPIPNDLIHTINAMIDHKKQAGYLLSNDQILWSFCYRTASRFIKKVMIEAGVTGIRARALGLRHGYAVHALNKVAITKVQKLMGHGYLTTTAIYLDVSGIEEREMVEQLWDEVQS